MSKGTIEIRLASTWITIATNGTIVHQQAELTPMHYDEVAKYLNENQGVISIALFLGTVIFGWASGIFSALRRKPRFRIALIPGPSFCCTFQTGQRENGHDVHRTAIALYLDITNIGSAPSDIKSVSVGYHWDLNSFSLLWIKNTLGWFWLTNQAVALVDFQVAIGASIKFFPFLTQRSAISGVSGQTFLEAGRSTNGVVYFEQGDSWGGFFPAVRNKKVRLKVRVKDVFGKSHARKFDVPSVSLLEAREYNPSFGMTLAELNEASSPSDI